MFLLSFKLLFDQAYWRGYRLRKSLQHRKKLLAKHQELMKKKKSIRSSGRKGRTRKSKV
jgi:hypothetical protein